MSDSKSEWNIETQITYPSIGETALSPDGGKVVYTVREPLMTDEKSVYINHLYMVDVATGAKRQLTYGEHTERRPRWSPCGGYIAFISTRAEKPNIYVMKVDGGEAWALTAFKKSGVSQFDWSPDGNSIIFTMSEPASEEKEKKKTQKDDAYLWHEDYTYTHIYTIPFKVGPRTPPEHKQITKGEYQVTSYNWLPASDKVAITYTKSPLVDEYEKTRLAIIPADPEIPVGLHDMDDIVLLSTGGGLKSSPDSKWIAATTADMPPKRAASNRVVLYPVAGGDPVPLYRTHDERPSPIGWTQDSSHIIVSESEGTISTIWALPVSGGPPVPLTTSLTRKKAYSMNRAGKLSYCSEDFHTPNTLYITHPTVDNVEKLVTETDMPEGWPDVEMPEAEVLQWQSTDGTTIEGMVYYPIGYKAGTKYPLIVEVHGGPTGVYGRTYVGAPFNHGNTALLTEAGFMMLRTNPRGSGGYGKEFRFANYADWGGGDYDDIMTGVVLLIERGLADPERMGILGWSYGGYMTSFVITQTDRFKAAVVGAGVTNLTSFNGVTDVPGLISDYFHGDHWENTALYMERSAMFNVQNAKTPTLIQHGENDARVPISQGKELFYALKKKRVPTHLVVYPRQGHGVQEPRLQMDVRTRPVDWFKRYVLGLED